MIKYIGSKRALLPWIVDMVREVAAAAPVRKVADVFSGSARVGHALKGAGFHVTACDLNAYAVTVARALVEADRAVYGPGVVAPILQRLAALPPVDGYFTEVFCRQARFFQPHNGMRIDAIRAGIDVEAGSDEVLRAALLYSLMRAADKVDSTTGVHMAYLKDWAPRAYNPLELEYPPLLDGPGEALQADANDFVRSSDADLVYLDPPYNQHSYLGNYHIWETLVLNDQPEAYGVARKRVDCRERKSRYNLKREAPAALAELIAGVSAPHVVCSFNNEGYFRPEDIEGLLARERFVTRLTREHRRYVGARIGIHNPQGEKVGKVSHTSNREFLFVATTSARVHEAMQRLAAGEGPVQESLFA